jgi:hypothetical protein
VEAEETSARKLDLAQETVEQQGVEVARLMFPDQDLFKALLLRYRRLHFELIDRVLNSPLPARSKLAAYLNLFDPTQHKGERQGESKKPFLSFSRESELAYEANDFTGAMYRFQAENVDRLDKLLADGIRDGAFAFLGTSKSMAMMMIAMLEEEAKAAARSGDFRTALDKLLMFASGPPSEAEAKQLAAFDAIRDERHRPNR